MKLKTIAITGTPGTGKTSLARKMAKEGYLVIDVAKLIKNYKLSGGYDRKRRCDVVDVNKVNKAVVGSIKAIKKELSRLKRNKNNEKLPIIKEYNKSERIRIKGIKGILIDSHLSHHLNKRYVDLCVVTRCSLKTLKKRLEKKGYPKGKVRENLDAEIFEICLNEAIKKGHKVRVVDTTKGIPALSLMDL